MKLRLTLALLLATTLACPAQKRLILPAQQRLVIIDQDGAGPENFTYINPDEGKCYKIGVHYWDDHKFGASYPTVRVWMNNTKLYETTVTPKMKYLDMWEVGSVCCSAQTFEEFKASDGGPVLIHNYVNPDFNFTPH